MFPKEIQVTNQPRGLRGGGGGFGGFGIPGGSENLIYGPNDRSHRMLNLNISLSFIVKSQ